MQAAKFDDENQNLFLALKGEWNNELIPKLRWQCKKEREPPRKLHCFGNCVGQSRWWNVCC